MNRNFQIFVILAYTAVIRTGSVKRPNIVLIIADDLGWDDVSFHSSDQVLTPNIDLLAYSGIALGRYYTHCVCTPSRSAILSGKYAHKLGMQGYPLTNGEDRGLPLSEKLLPQYLKELGYATHLVGKWHVGHSRKEHLPTLRGFDSHFGHWGGYVDYYEYVMEETWSTGKVSGFDLHRNMTADWSTEGYLTDVYTEEAESVIMRHDTSAPLFLMLAHMAPHAGNDGALMQAPHETVRAMRHVESPHRRILAAMVKKLDDSVGNIVKALSDKGILNDTILVFVSDNGGMTAGDSPNFASNWPLRGSKMSPFEGGIRVAGLIWSPTIDPPSHVWSGYMHAADWVPTLLKAAGAETPLDIDGVNLWDSIISNATSKREELIEIDDYTGFASIIAGGYKLVTGNPSAQYSNYQGQDLRGIIGKGPVYEEAIMNSKMYSILNSLGRPFKMADANLRNEIRINCTTEGVNLCFPQKDKPCLFNIKEDPCETKDLSTVHPHLVDEMSSRLQREIAQTIPRIVPLFRDPRAWPKLHNYTWTHWYDSHEDSTH